MATATTTEAVPVAPATPTPAPTPPTPTNPQQSQMDSMLALAGEPPPATSPTPSAVVVPLPLQPTGDTAPSGDPAVVSSPIQPPITSDPSESVAPTEGVVDLATAMAEINRLSAENTRLRDTPPVAAPEPATIPSYLTAEELESGKMGTVEGINEVIHRSTQKAVETAMRNMVPIAEQIAMKSLAQKTIIDTFYDANKDLVPHKAFVGNVAKTIFDANPGKGLEELLPEVAKVARQSIKALIKQMPVVPAPPTNPATPNATQVAPTPSLIGQPKIMAELLKHSGLELT